MDAPRRQKIPVFLLVRTAFQLLWQQKDDLLRLGLIPALVCFGAFLFGQDDLAGFFQAMNAAATNASSGGADPYAALAPGTMGAVLVMTGVLLAAYSLMTVNWLRFVLLGPMAAVGIGLNVGGAHWRYLLTFVGMGLAASLVMMVASMPVSLLPGVTAQIALIAVFIAMLLAGMRFLPYLVSIAVGQPMKLRESWAIARGNAVSLLVALVLAWIPFVIVQSVVVGILDFAGFTDAAPVATLFIGALFQVASWVGQAGVLATAYRSMVGIKV
jgi:hypothetical protein